MVIKGQEKLCYVFGGFRVDVSERELFDEKGPVSLTPKAFDTLLALVENSGRVVGTEQLMALVWPDSFVEENNLAQNISTLRKILGVDGGEFIKTVPKRGYRFVADVKEIREEDPNLVSSDRDSQGQASAPFNNDRPRSSNFESSPRFEFP